MKHYWPVKLKLNELELPLYSLLVCYSKYSVRFGQEVQTQEALQLHGCVNLRNTHKQESRVRAH